MLCACSKTNHKTMHRSVRKCDQMDSGLIVGHLLFSRARSVVILQPGGCVHHARRLIVLTATRNFMGVVQVWRMHAIAWATTQQKLSSVTNISSGQAHGAPLNAIRKNWLVILSPYCASKQH